MAEQRLELEEKPSLESRMISCSEEKRHIGERVETSVSGRRGENVDKYVDRGSQMHKADLQ